MNTRERFQAVMNFRPFDRLPILEWAPWWDKTLARWRSEGLPENAADRYAICRHFGLDVYCQDWFRIYSPGCPAPASHGAGIISDENDYERVRPYLYPANAVDLGMWKKWADEQKTGRVVLWFTVDGFFWFPRQLLGIERHLYAFYDQAGLMHRINADLVEWMSRMIDDVCSVCEPDFMTFAEDMSYNKGPMLSKEHFEQFVAPYYARIIPKLKKHNVIPIVDSDGDVSVPAAWFEAAGIEGILPLERQAGVDVSQLRREHPEMRFIGHFDKMTMNKGEAAMRAEFERLLPVAAKGGFLPACDHQTPPGVSCNDYRLYISLFNEYAREAGLMSQSAAGLS
ncbi:MAG: uroporphyrinogen decarboxylase family protein [Kiritimatiellae bacterium]|nr:uroporphyrinogen decarboxylase family protein [Kiritimatiellia bacterium]